MPIPLFPRATRWQLRLPIAYRRAMDPQWTLAKVQNISESGVLFGPTALTPGVPVEVMFSTPVAIGSIASGKSVCVGSIVRTSEGGHVAARFDECRFVLD